MQFEKNKIYLGDCIELIDNLPNNSIDLVLTDPPYGDEVGYGRNNKEIANNTIDINYKLLDKIYPKMKQDTNLYMFTNWKHEVDLRNYIVENTNFKIRMLLVMVKNNFGLGYGFRNQHELCLVLEKGKPCYNDNGFSNVIRMEQINHDESTHPHQKGLRILEKMIRHSSNEGDLVLDPFMGSGSTAIASLNTDRAFIGFEIDKNYYNLALKRLGRVNKDYYNDLIDDEQPGQMQLF